MLGDLVDARLLTSYEIEGGKTDASQHRIEIVHESLLKAWPRLVRWQSQDEDAAHLRDQVKQAAHLWAEKGRTADLLWTGTAYREYALWRERYDAPLTAVEDAFAAAMTARARRTKRIRRVAVAGVFVALTAVAVAIGISRQAAIASARRAEASKLLALGQARLAEDATEALALVTASLEVVDTPEARRFAVRALWDSSPALEMLSGDADLRVPAFSPDGRRLAVAGWSGTARVWSDDASGPVLLPGHEQTPSAPNVPRWASNRLLVTGLGEGRAERVHVWSFPEGTRVRTIEFGGTARWQVEAENLFAEVVEPGSADRPDSVVLRSWRLPGGEPETLGRISWRALNPSSSAFDPGSRAWLFTKGRDLYLRFLASVDQAPVVLLARHDTEVTLIESTRPGQFIARESSGALWQWSRTLDGLKRVHVTAQPAGAPEATVPSPLGSWLVEQPLRNASARLWAIPPLPGARPLVLRRSGSWYGSMGAVHPSDEWIAITTHGLERVTLWPAAGARPGIVDGYFNMRRPLQFSGEGQWLATGWSDAKPRLWPVPGAVSGDVRVLDGTRAPDLISALAVDPRGRYLFAVSILGRAMVIPLDGGPLRSLEGFKSGTLLHTAAVSPSGRRVATAFNFGTGPRVLQVWDLADGSSRSFPLPGAERGATRETNTTAAGYAGGVSFVAFTSESILHTGGTAGVLRWDIESGSHEVLVANEPGTIVQMALSADGTTALTVDWPMSAAEECRPVTIRNLTRPSARILSQFGDCVRDFSIDAAGSVIVTGDVDGVIRVGRAGSGEPHQLLGHKGVVMSVRQSPDGRWIASAGEDNTLRVWPTPDLTKQPLHTLPHRELIAKLRSLTNLRAVRDPESATGWKIEVGPFPGWKNVPAW